MKGTQGQVRIGRMSAETLIETVKKELEMEVKQDGLSTVKNRLMLEAIALDDLSMQQQQIQQAVKEQCLVPVLKRAKEGYSVRGLFWQQTENKLDVLVTQEKLKAIDESIDWLNTRKKIIDELENHFSLRDVFRY
jgi:hypothetical protein